MYKLRKNYGNWTIEEVMLALELYLSHDLERLSKITDSTPEIIALSEVLNATDFITQEIGVLSESNSGWHKELNMVSWNGGKPKLDIRDWAPDHSKMGKGVTLNEAEVQALKQMLNEL